MFEYIDGEGVLWQWRYIVTQSESEGPERLECRRQDEKGEWEEWLEYPGHLPLIREVGEYFFGLPR